MNCIFQIGWEAKIFVRCLKMGYINIALHLGTLLDRKIYLTLISIMEVNGGHWPMNVLKKYMIYY